MRKVSWKKLWVRCTCSAQSSINLWTDILGLARQQNLLHRWEIFDLFTRANVFLHYQKGGSIWRWQLSWKRAQISERSGLPVDETKVIYILYCESSESGNDIYAEATKCIGKWTSQEAINTVISGLDNIIMTHIFLRDIVVVNQLHFGRGRCDAMQMDKLKPKMEPDIYVVKSTCDVMLYAQGYHTVTDNQNRFYLTGHYKDKWTSGLHNEPFWYISFRKLPNPLRMLKNKRTNNY